MFVWTEFDSSGKVFQRCSSTDSVTPNSERYAIGEYGDDFYMDPANTILPRPSMPLIVSGRTITGIPAGSVLAIGDQTFEVDDGEAEIDGYAGTVKIACWPYLDAEVTV